MKVINLLPGQVFEGNVYIGQFPHPIWPRLQCVVWRLRDGSWSHDALSPAQDVGEPDPVRSLGRQGNLRLAMLGDAMAKAANPGRT